ncbi:MAG: zinc protease [Acidobacteriota bacterium]|nr:zinc protease [Acidobacteriota bacterium]
MRFTRLLSWTLAVALLAPSVALAQAGRNAQKTTTTKTAAAASTASTGVLPSIDFTEFRLANGLRVILHRDPSTPIVGVNIWYHVGSKNETPGKTGYAHLFEHMMFQGSRDYDDDYFKPIQEAGGNLNGSTSTDRTNYWEVVPSNFLELALFMESNRMGGLLDVLNEAKLSNQRDVVKNEKRQSYDNRPYGLIGARINEILYPENHPYHWLTIGSLDDLTKASIADISSFFRSYYTPNNASLAIAGDFDPADARRLVEKYFGPIPKGPEVVRPNPPQPKLDGTKRVEMQDRVALPRLYMTWHTVPQYTPDEASLDTLASILGGGKSSRLYRSLVYERQIAQDVSAFNNSEELAGTFRVTATAKPGKTLAELEGAINEEIEKMKQEAATSDEIERAYNGREAAFIYGLQTVGDFGGKNDQLNQYATFLGKPGYFAEDLARYRRVNGDEVKRVATQFLSDNRLIVSVIPTGRGRSGATGPVPEMPAKPNTDPQAAGAGAASTTTSTATTTSGGDKPAGAQTQTKAQVAPSQAAGATPPATNVAPTAPNAGTAKAKRNPIEDSVAGNLPKPKPDPKLTLPRIQRHKLSNGLEVLIVEHHELPVVNMNLVIKSGAAADPNDRAGLASLAADMLDEGTKTRNSLDISNQLSSIGARLFTGASWDSSNVNLLTLTRHLDRALDIFSDVLLNPSFPDTDLSRLRAQRNVGLQQRRDDANSIAGTVYSSLLYGRNHPYGHPQNGDEASIKAMTGADVRGFYETYYRPNNAALIVSGDVTPATIIPRLEKALGAWRPANVPAVNVSAPGQDLGKTRIYLVDRPGAAQSVIQIGQIGVSRSTPDYFPLLVMNSMLGGAFVSRINLNLREDKGYTYGARTGFDYRRGAGPFTASAGVQTAVTKESVYEFMKELRGVRGGIPITQKELDYQKQAIIRGYPRGFETPEQIARQLSALVLYDLPDDYFNNYLSRVQAVSLADVQRVAQKYLDPDHMAILVVGDRKVIEPGLRSLGDIGSITILDAEGRPTAGERAGSPQQ